MNLLEGLTEIKAFLTTDGKKYFNLMEAETRQKILNNGDKPCSKCDCRGKLFRQVSGFFGGWEEECKDCNGHGFLKLDYVKLRSNETN